MAGKNIQLCVGRIQKKTTLAISVILTFWCLNKTREITNFICGIVFRAFSLHLLPSEPRHELFLAHWEGVIVENANMNKFWRQVVHKPICCWVNASHFKNSTQNQKKMRFRPCFKPLVRNKMFFRPRLWPWSWKNGGGRWFTQECLGQNLQERQTENGVVVVLWLGTAKRGALESGCSVYKTQSLVSVGPKKPHMEMLKPLFSTSPIAMEWKSNKKII